MPPPRTRPRRIHHHISLSFSTPETVSPQLYEWVSTGFPVPVIVHHYSISATHPPPSLSSFSSTEAVSRISPSSSRSEGSDLDPHDSFLTELDSSGEECRRAWEELESYVSTSESSAEGLRRRFQIIESISRVRSLGNDEEVREDDPDLSFVPLEDPWTTWFPPTPPLRPRDDSRSGSNLSLHLNPGVTPSVVLYGSRGRNSELDAINEGDVEVTETRLRQEFMRDRVRVNEDETSGIARASKLCEGWPDEEDDFARRINEEQDSLERTSFCWACRAALQRYGRRHGLLP